MQIEGMSYDPRLETFGNIKLFIIIFILNFLEILPKLMLNSLDL